MLASSPGPSRGWKQEPWYGLWSSLCHQGDVYTASYAAVPHIVAVAIAAEAPVDFGFFQLPAAVEVARHGGRGPQIPQQLAHGYHQALARLGECVSLHHDAPWDRAMLLSAAAAQAAAKGHVDIAEALLNLGDDLIARINRHELD